MKRPKNIRQSEWDSLPDYVKRKELLHRKEQEERSALTGEIPDLVKGLLAAEAGLPMDVVSLLAPGGGKGQAQRFSEMRPGGYSGYEEEIFDPQYKGTTLDIAESLGADLSSGATTTGMLLAPGSWFFAPRAVGKAIKGVKALTKRTKAIPKPPPPPPKTLARKIKESKFKRIKAGKNKGQYIGAPEGVNTPQKLRKLIENKYKYMEKGVPGRYWYSDSGEIIGEITPDTEMANKLTGSIGVTSQGTGVDPNLGASIKAHSQRMVGDPVETGRFPNKMGSSINKIYEGQGPELGPKRTPFSNQLALGGGFDPNPETAKRAVHDIWDARASGFGDDFDKGLTTAQHEFLDKIDDILIIEANERGLGGFEDWTTGRSQAAVWVAKKSEQEGRTIEEGAKSYIDYLEKYVTQGSYETIPGKTGNHFPELHGMSDAFKEDYHQQVKELLTQGGHDKFARGYGALSLGTLDAQGYYKGVFSPGTQVRTLGGRETGGAWADPATAKIHRAMEGSRALVLDQDAAAWSQLGNAGEPLVRANAFVLNYGHPINKEEIIDLMDELVAQYGNDALEHFAPVPSKGGARLLYINPLPNYQKVGQLVKKIAKEKNIPVTTHKNIIKYPDGYTENNWAQQQLGQDYLPLINQIDNPIIKERFDAIVPEIADNLRINDNKIAKKFGMTVSKNVQDMREAIARGGYDGLMTLIKTGVLPASIIGFIGTGLTQTQREKIGLVPLYPKTGY